METNKSVNLLDMMTPEHREQALKRFHKRMEKRENETVKVPPEIYLMAEFGFYFGWDGVEAIRSNRMTLAEACVLLEGARKVWYAKQLEINKMRRIAVDSSNPFAKREEKSRAYTKGTKDFVDRAKVEVE